MIYLFISFFYWEKIYTRFGFFTTRPHKEKKMNLNSAMSVIPSYDTVRTSYVEDNNSKMDLFREKIATIFSSGVKSKNNPIYLSNVEYEWQANEIKTMFSFEPKYKIVFTKKETHDIRDEAYSTIVAKVLIEDCEAMLQRRSVFCGRF